MSRFRFLGLERPGKGNRFRLRDRLVCSLGLALGVFFLILSWGFIVPVEELIKVKILGTLPDRLVVSKSAISMGPVALGGAIDEDLVSRVEKIERIKAVYRQAHFPDPAQLHARYGGEGLVTDLVLEMVDEAQVAHEIARGYRFVDPGPDEPIPAVMPRAILDLINSGITVNTKLPHLTESALIGKGFDLYLGTSSFRPGTATKVRCTVVGISDQVGAGGPAIPYDAGLRLAKGDPIIHALTLELEDPADTQLVSREVERLGLRAPRQEIASRVTSVATILKLFAVLLPLAVLSVTSLALGAVLELQVSRERQTIALYRALGATRAQITVIYLLRALSVAVLSIIVGVAGGWFAGLGLAGYLKTKLPPDLLGGMPLFTVSISALFLAVGFCLALTVIAGWYPARQAARQDPAHIFREPG